MFPPVNHPRPLNPVADAYVMGGTNAGTNYGTATTLITKDDTGTDFDRETFLRWDLSGVSGKIVQAKVRLAGTTIGQVGNENCATFVNDDTCDEATINLTNKPAAGKLFAQWLQVAGQAVEFTVAVTTTSAGNLNLRIKAGAVILDLDGAPLNTASALPDDTTIPVVPGSRWWDGGTADLSGNGNAASAGGAGTWDTTIKNWDQGTGVLYAAWNNGTAAIAAFAGTAGTVTQAADITASGLCFDTAGYSITGGTNGLTKPASAGSLSPATTTTAWTTAWHGCSARRIRLKMLSKNYQRPLTTEPISASPSAASSPPPAPL